MTRGELRARDRGRAMWLPERGVKAEPKGERRDTVAGEQDTAQRDSPGV